MNLLTNANKFTQNGVIKVHCAHEINSTQEHYLKVYVKDKGIGISESDQAKLFNPFVMLNNGKELNPNGVGLGLFICKNVLEQIGGSL
jgi:two-component system sensor histidine kinase EvgS